VSLYKFKETNIFAVLHLICLLQCATRNNTKKSLILQSSSLNLRQFSLCNNHYITAVASLRTFYGARVTHSSENIRTVSKLSVIAYGRVDINSRF